jgi:hypothetical protein
MLTIKCVIRAESNASRPKTDRPKGSVELKIGNEFIGTIHRDAEDGDVSYAVQIVVLAEDLQDND